MILVFNGGLLSSGTSPQSDVGPPGDMVGVRKNTYEHERSRTEGSIL